MEKEDVAKKATKSQLSLWSLVEESECEKRLHRETGYVLCPNAWMNIEFLITKNYQNVKTKKCKCTNRE